MRYGIIAVALMGILGNLPTSASAAQISLSPSAALQMLLGEPAPETIKACKKGKPCGKSCIAKNKRCNK